MKNNKEEKQSKLKCSCGYLWNYSGKLQKATCPNCSKKVLNKKIKGEKK